MRGRKPKPTALHLLTAEGGRTAGHRPLNADEPQPAAGGMERPPAWLNKRAKAIWRELMRDAPPGLLTRLDRKTAAMYCQSSARLEQVEQIIEEEGFTFMSDKGFVCQRPEAAIAKGLYGTITRLCAEMGLTPSSRSRVKVNRDQKPKSKLDKFIA
ncbi:MAG TPA: phage terminase small subunit P27 family [Gemmatimonadales bacterium]|nr:phage terminase small subunit P27 family [Gemmatimonadales bacterium]